MKDFQLRVDGGGGGGGREKCLSTGVKFIITYLFEEILSHKKRLHASTICVAGH